MRTRNPLDERIRPKIVRLSPCPNCGSDWHWVNRSMCTPFWQYSWMPHKWFIECPECHWRGKTRWTLRRAIREWEKEYEVYGGNK